MWKVAGAPPKSTARSGPDDLGHGDAGQHVGGMEDGRPDERHRGDEAHQRDRHDLDRDAGLDAVDEVLAGVFAVAEVAGRGDGEDRHRACDEVGSVGAEELHHGRHARHAGLGEGAAHDRLPGVGQDHVQAPGVGDLGLDVGVGREGRGQVRDVLEAVARAGRTPRSRSSSPGAPRRSGGRGSSARSSRARSGRGRRRCRRAGCRRGRRARRPSGALAMARSTTSRGKRTRWPPSSVGSPASSNRRRISGPRTSMPVSARMRIASSMMRSMSAGLSTFRVGRIAAHSGPCVRPPALVASASRACHGERQRRPAMPIIDDIVERARRNAYFREVVSTGPHCQVVVMSLPPGEDIGEEVHEDVDQVFVIVEGSGTRHPRRRAQPRRAGPPRPCHGRRPARRRQHRSRGPAAVHHLRAAAACAGHRPRDEGRGGGCRAPRGHAHRVGPSRRRAAHEGRGAAHRGEGDRSAGRGRLAGGLRDRGRLARLGGTSHRGLEPRQQRRGFEIGEDLARVGPPLRGRPARLDRGG